MTRILACLLAALLPALAWAADPAAADAKPPPIGELIHDLRDFLPETESKAGSAADPIPAFSVKDDGYWRKYRPYNKNGTGCLSRTEIIAIVADLEKTLRSGYPEVYAAIDSDGDDTITTAKFNAYLASTRK
jgi:hypothetical protein